MFRALFLSLLIFSVCQCEETDPIAHTNNGAVRGTVMKDRKGADFFAFQSIPYARPPVGDLRFKAPQLPENWTDIKNATRDVPKCVQLKMFSNETEGQEDCLYLSVYTPRMSNIRPLPVMVYVHGGRFTGGSSTIDQFGPQFLMPKDVVLVTLNYRVGAFGFLSLQGKSAELSANNGLKDQVFALKWVRDNIRRFGGNPDDVTLFGESAGSASVHFLMLSPLAKGLFHRVIAHSGAATATWANGARNSAAALAKELDIKTESIPDMIQALKTVSAQSIAIAQEVVFYVSPQSTLSYGPPVVEGPGEDSFLPDHPRNLILAGNYNMVPLIMGYNNKEGIMYDMDYKVANKTYVYEQYEYVPYYLNQSRLAEITAKQRDFYFNGSTPRGSQDMIDLVTDMFFKYDIVTSAKIHAQTSSSRVYLYEFSMDTELNIPKRRHPITATYPGATHGDDLGYIFMSSSTPEIKPGSIEELSLDRMITLWTNFAIYDNPTVAQDQLLQNQIWRPINGSKLNYISLGANLESKIYENVNYDFWANLHEKYDVFGK